MPKQNAALLNLDHAHCRAVCDEIGERLAYVMKPAADIPPRLLVTCSPETPPILS